MGESHRGVSSLQRKLIEEPLKLQKNQKHAGSLFGLYMFACYHQWQADNICKLSLSLLFPVEEKRYPWGLRATWMPPAPLAAFVFLAPSSDSARSRHVRSFVAGAINSLQRAAPVVLPFADTPGASLVYMPTLHVAEKYWHCQSAAHCSWT